jgi:NAD(P)-dependent dehydrogenase (short-subunit alcohol dehydrogenase family)
MAAKAIADLHDLSGKVAVITGAGAGIGRAAALRLAEAGARILCVDMDSAAATKTADLLAPCAGVEVSVADVRDPERVEAAAGAAIRAWGHIDIVVNCAGIYPHSPVLETTPELWDNVQAINVRGTFLTSQACARRMQGGSIVNIASKSALQPTRGLAHYAASKGAVVGLTKALALELGSQGIRVNAVAPGAVQTEGTAALSGSLTTDAMPAPDEPQGRQSFARIAHPDEIARIILFLASDWSSFMTGTTVLADAGYVLVGANVHRWTSTD